MEHTGALPGLTVASVPIMLPIFIKLFPDRSQAKGFGTNIISNNIKHSINNTSGNGMASKENFQHTNEFPLDPLRPEFSDSHTYITEGHRQLDDMDSHRSSQSESELVTSHTKVKQEWDVRRG